MLQDLTSRYQRGAMIAVVLYGIVTATMLQYRLTLSPKAARGVLDFLVKRGWLARQVVLGTVVIYRLTSAAARSLGLSPTHARPLTLQGVTARLPIAHDCARRHVDIITPEELKASYLAPFAAMSGWFAPGAEAAETVYYVVDFGKDPRRMAWKLQRLLSRFALAAPDLIADRHLGVRLMVAHAAKRESCFRALAKNDSPMNGAIEIGVAPELQTLLLSRRPR